MSLNDSLFGDELKKWEEHFNNKSNPNPQLKPTSKTQRLQHEWKCLKALIKSHLKRQAQ